MDQRLIRSGVHKIDKKVNDNLAVKEGENEYYELFDNMPTTFLQQLSADDYDSNITYDGGGLVLQGDLNQSVQAASVVVKEETVSQDGTDVLQPEPKSLHEALQSLSRDSNIGRGIGEVKFFRGGGPGPLLGKAQGTQDISGGDLFPLGHTKETGELNADFASRTNSVNISGEHSGSAISGARKLGSKTAALKALRRTKEPSLNVTFPSRVGQYELRILKQPEEQHRARYLTEGSRGTVKDVSQQGHPTVQLLGCSQPGLVLQVFVGADVGKVKAHGFYQAVKVTNKNSTPCIERDIEGTTVIEIALDPKLDMTATVDCVGILKLRNADVEQRIGLAKSKKKSTYARLVFRVNIPKLDGGCITLQAASNPILCTQPTGAPEICKKSIGRCSVKGGQEMFIIGKNFMKGTQVIFEQIRDDTVLWSREAEIDQDFFQATHIVCRVPPYCTQDVKEPVEVQIVVHSSGRASEHASFIYDPLCASSVPMEIEAQGYQFEAQNTDPSLSGVKRTYAERSADSPSSSSVQPDSSTPAHQLEVIQVATGPGLDQDPPRYILTNHSGHSFVASATSLELSAAAARNAPLMVEQTAGNSVTQISLLINSTDLQFSSPTVSDLIKEENSSNSAILQQQQSQSSYALLQNANKKPWLAATITSIADTTTNLGQAGDSNDSSGVYGQHAGFSSVVYRDGSHGRLSREGSSSALEAAGDDISQGISSQPAGLYRGVTIASPSGDQMGNPDGGAERNEEEGDNPEDASEPNRKRKASNPCGVDRLNLIMQIIEDGSNQSTITSSTLIESKGLTTGSDVLWGDVAASTFSNDINQEPAISCLQNLPGSELVKQSGAETQRLSASDQRYQRPEANRTTQCSFMELIDSSRTTFTNPMPPITAPEFSLSPPGSALDVLEHINDSMLFNFTSDLLQDQFNDKQLSPFSTLDASLGLSSEPMRCSPMEDIKNSNQVNQPNAQSTGSAKVSSNLPYQEDVKANVGEEAPKNMGENLQQSLSELENLRSQISSSSAISSQAISYHQTAQDVSSLDNAQMSTFYAPSSSESHLSNDGVLNSEGENSAVSSNFTLAHVDQGSVWKRTRLNSAGNQGVDQMGQGDTSDNMAWPIHDTAGEVINIGDQKNLTIEQLADELSKMSRENQNVILNSILPQLPAELTQESKMVAPAVHVSSHMVPIAPAQNTKSAQGHGSEAQSNLTALLTGSIQPALINILQQQLTDKKRKELHQQQLHQQQMHHQMQNQQQLQNQKNVQDTHTYGYGLTTMDASTGNQLSNYGTQHLLRRDISNIQQQTSMEFIGQTSGNLSNSTQHFGVPRNYDNGNIGIHSVHPIQIAATATVGNTAITSGSQNLSSGVGINTEKPMEGCKPMDCVSNPRGDRDQPMDVSVTPQTQYYTRDSRHLADQHISTLGAASNMSTPAPLDSCLDFNINPSITNNDNILNSHTAEPAGIKSEDVSDPSTTMLYKLLTEDQGSSSHDILTYASPSQAASETSSAGRLEPVTTGSGVSTNIQSELMHVVTSPNSTLPYLNADDISRCLNSMNSETR